MEKNNLNFFQKDVTMHVNIKQTVALITAAEKQGHTHKNENKISGRSP